MLLHRRVIGKQDSERQEQETGRQPGVEDRAGERVRGGGSRIAEMYTCEYNSHGRLTAFEVSLVCFFQATIFFLVCANFDH